MQRATWRKRRIKRAQTGQWEYNNAGGYFVIQLDSNDPVTGEPRAFRVYGDVPAFNGYVRDAK